MWNSIAPWVLVAVGGACGACARYGLGRLEALFSSTPSLWPTLIANISGSMAMGAAYMLIVQRVSVHADWRYVLMVGFLGAFTTWSSFALETVNLLQAGRMPVALLYVLATSTCCFLGCWMGMQLATR